MSPLTSAPRRLAATVLAATLAAGALAAVPAVADAVAPSRAVAPAVVAPVAGRGEMDAQEVVLSAEAPGGASSRSGAPAPGAAGWSGVVDLRAGTQTVALTWDGDASGPAGPASGRLSLRWSSGTGPWTDWLAVAPDPDDQGGEGEGRVGSEVVWLGSSGADRIEVRVDAGPLVDLRLLRMHYDEAATTGEPQPAVADGARRTGRAALPAIQPRSAWTTAGWATGTSGCGSGPSVASGLQHAVVHHTASTNSYTQSQVPGLLESIRLYHTSGLGWCDIAYNFLVDRFGTIWQGRSGDITKPVIGGHAKGFNTGSVGVSLLGQFEPGASPTAAQPSLAMLDSTARLLAWKLDLHGLSPKGSTTVTSGGSTRYAAGVQVTLPIINAHRDHSLTSCPGANVVTVMGALRDLVARHSTGSSTTTTSTTTTSTTAPPPARDWTPFTSAEELTYRQFVDVLRTPGTWDDRRWWNEALVAGTTNRNALVFSLVRSTRSEERSASVVRLYLAYFDRAPDHSGLAHWFGRMDAGEGIRTVSAAFARSPEFTARYGSLTDDQFVRLVYANVLGRSPDPAGFTYWTGRLRSRSESRGGLMALFSESGEYRSLTRAATDVVLVHDAMLGRAASTATLDSWVGRIQGGGSVATLIAQLFASTEYAARVS